MSHSRSRLVSPLISLLGLSCLRRSTACCCTRECGPTLFNSGRGSSRTNQASRWFLVGHVIDKSPGLPCPLLNITVDTPSIIKFQPCLMPNQFTLPCSLARSAATITAAAACTSVPDTEPELTLSSLVLTVLLLLISTPYSTALLWPPFCSVPLRSRPPPPLPFATPLGPYQLPGKLRLLLPPLSPGRVSFS